jgi:TolA-binding protein
MKDKSQKIKVPSTAKLNAALLILMAMGLALGNGASGMALSFKHHLLPSLQGGENGDAAKSLRAGRDLIEEENWQAAARSFRDFLATYPRHRDVDAALYWLAFALKKQGKVVEADQTLARLIKEFPASRWKDDAQAGRVEMAPQLGNQTVIDQALEGSADKEDDELKTIALQSLVFSNPERALPLLREVLKPDSKASRKTKQTAIVFLAQIGSRGFDALMDVARHQNDLELRRTAIFWLGQSADDRAFEFLREVVVNAGEKKELVDSALFALAQSRNPRARAYLLELARSAPSEELRRSVIANLGMRGGDAVVDEMIAIYDAESDAELKKQILFALSAGGNQRGRAKLLDVARNESSVELRKQALFWIGQRGGEETAEQLVQFFDTEQSEAVKEHLLMVLSQSRSKTAMRKLMEIAKSSPSIELRKRAIFWLGQSKDPEAKRFIEEILK